MIAEARCTKPRLNKDALEGNYREALRLLDYNVSATTADAVIQKDAYVTVTMLSAVSDLFVTYHPPLLENMRARLENTYVFSVPASTHAACPRRQSSRGLREAEFVSGVDTN